MITLDRLANVLGGYGVRLRTCDVDRSVELRSVVLEPNTDGEIDCGDLLLAIGARSATEAVQRAAASRSVVVLTRGDDDVAGVRGVAVMVVDPAMSWSELAAVVYGLVLEGRETESGRGPTDLFALADSLAAAVGAAVVIEDEGSRLLAYSRGQRDADPARARTILERQAPDDVRESLSARGVFVHLQGSNDPLFVAPDPERGLTGRMVVAARLGRHLLGSVWVSCSTPLTGAALSALSDGAHTVALHLLRSRASADLERQVESDLVLRLLDGTADAATVVSRLGLPQTAVRVIALRATVGDEPHAGLLLAFERATSGFGWSRPGRSALADNTVYTVLPGDEATTARQWVLSLRAALPANVAVAAGISAPAAAGELPSARTEADECLALHELSTSAHDVPAYDESWHDILLQRLRAAAGSGRRTGRGPVADLRRHDREHATTYVATLWSWLAEQGDPVRAAERLGVHENTVRNRLRRMAEVTRLELHDPRQRLAMMVELAAIDPLS